MPFMICFDVFLNGEKLCRAGMKELVVMNSILDMVKLPESGEEELSLHVGGLYDNEAKGQVHPRWIARMPLNEGDEITIRIVNSDSADQPTGEHVSTPEWIREQERKYYEHVKAKFEPHDSTLEEAVREERGQ